MADIMEMVELSLPGVSITYQGEELGMTDTYISWADTKDPSACQTNENVYEQYTRDPARTPFQWDATANAGFTTASKPWLPVNSNYETINVDSEQKADKSHLKVFEELVKLRDDDDFHSSQFGTAVLGQSTFAIIRIANGRTYFTLVNLANAQDTVNVAELFTKFSTTKSFDTAVVRVASVSSKRTAKESVTLSSIQLDPYEGLVLQNMLEFRKLQSALTLKIILISLAGDTSSEDLRALHVSDWWEKAGFYQVYPRSFKDSDGDGIGDLNGITVKLPYLKDIGMKAFWLSPIFKSPMVDFGYDISDFVDIQPEYGTMTDFENLVQQAKRLGLRIILDFVPNHSSDEHEWFGKSENREVGYEDFYVWNEGLLESDGTRSPPNNWNEDFGGSAWQWSEKRQQFYLHQFHRKQPDLNYRNPAVVEAMKNVLRFWLGKGYTRDPARTPFQWDATANAGFTTASKPWLPVNSNYETINVDSEQKADKSHLKVFEELVKLRDDDDFHSSQFGTAVLGQSTFAIIRIANGRTYFTLVNLANAQDTVNVAELFTKFSTTKSFDTAVVRVASVSSKRTAKESVTLSSIQLDPYEGLVLQSGANHCRSVFVLVILALAVIYGWH
ncbi:alpha-amylase 2 [Culex quinquefasciatus]|uniref:alpha-glucosidase n=1 Tax=Culex quinquefasciatus TaxID=7176 RepID=B0WFP6_CULQU|nr:alpha-amylase 2 [Culex quinquefasciatus]|eukprot:XP_001847530.1 alpha-amylase 2 [Culex quinquefasciatus]